VTGVSERNKHKVELFVETVWNEGRLELVDDLVAADYVGHISCVQGAVLGPEGVRALVARRRREYAGLYIKIDDLIAEHDLVVTRWRASVPGRRRAGRGLLVERSCLCSGISIVRLLAGKQVDSHTGYTTVDQAA
jgi:SnoaL-like protein